MPFTGSNAAEMRWLIREREIILCQRDAVRRIAAEVRTAFGADAEGACLRIKGQFSGIGDEGTAHESSVVGQKAPTLERASRFAANVV